MFFIKNIGSVDCFLFYDFAKLSMLIYLQDISVNKRFPRGNHRISDMIPQLARGKTRFVLGSF